MKGLFRDPVFLVKQVNHQGSIFEYFGLVFISGVPVFWS